MATSDAEADPSKPKVDLTGLHRELEELEPVRRFLKETGVLFDDKFNPETIHAADQDHVYEMINALLGRTACVEGHPSLPVHRLREEIDCLYKACSIVVGEAQIILDSWCIRKIIAFAKMKVRRAKVSNATWPKVSIFEWASHQTCGVPSPVASYIHGWEW